MLQVSHCRLNTLKGFKFLALYYKLKLVFRIIEDIEKCKKTPYIERPIFIIKEKMYQKTTKLFVSFALMLTPFQDQDRIT